MLLGRVLLWLAPRKELNSFRVVISERIVKEKTLKPLSCTSRLIRGKKGKPLRSSAVAESFYKRAAGSTAANCTLTWCTQLKTTLPIRYVGRRYYPICWSGPKQVTKLPSLQNDGMDFKYHWAHLPLWELRPTDWFRTLTPIPCC